VTPAPHDHEELNLMTRTMAMRWGALALLGAMALAACGGSAAPTTAPAASEPSAATTAPESVAPESVAPSAAATTAPGSADPAPSDAAVASTEPAASPAANPAAAALASKPWANAPLTDVETGETFTIAELAGKPVFIESMAIWCSNCRAQQGRFTEAFAQMAPGTAEYVVLTVDPSETAEDLARYKSGSGFTGRYAVAGKELAKALVAEFGANAINPPSVPVIFVSPTGEVEFSTGQESVEQIVEKAGA
jgi:thiol-disulfide isomerase/thioredoxin